MDELELNAINCAGSAARAKRRMGMPANSATTGYSSAMTNRQPMEYAAM